MKQDDHAVLLDLVQRGVLVGVEVFGTNTCCDHGVDPSDAACESTGYGLCDRFSEHSVGSDCNRADAFLLRPSDPHLTADLRAAIGDEGPWG